MKFFCYKLLSTYTRKFLSDLYVRIVDLSSSFPRISKIQTYTYGSSSCHTSRSKNGNEYKYARKKILAANEVRQHASKGPTSFSWESGGVGLFLLFSMCSYEIPIVFPSSFH
jgi:hypothetical protein